MKKMIAKVLTSLIVLASLNPLEACTAFQLHSQDGTPIYCRSMEFGLRLDSNLLIVPVGTEYVGTGFNQQPGLKWKVKYGHVGMNQNVARTIVSDGMNEKGLIVGALYLPGFSQYELSGDNSKTLSSWEVMSYLLGSCATVEEVKQAFATIIVAHTIQPNLGAVLPVHYYITDGQGNNLVVEYVNGKRNEHSNPIGMLTNSPPFEWQKINLSNFVNLSPINVPKLNLKQFNVQSLGQGSGLLGIPGDYTPPSRFVRAALYSQWATQKKTAEETVVAGFHILNTFDIFDGIVRSDSQSNNDSDTEITQWTIVHDRKNLKTYFRGYNSLAIQMVDLKKIDFSRAGLREIPLQSRFVVEEAIDREAKPLKINPVPN
jgi:choloylglycine hydrolase